MKYLAVLIMCLNLVACAGNAGKPTVDVPEGIAPAETAHTRQSLVPVTPLTDPSIEQVDSCEQFNRQEQTRREQAGSCYCPCVCDRDRIVCAPCVVCEQEELNPHDLQEHKLTQ